MPKQYSLYTPVIAGRVNKNLSMQDIQNENVQLFKWNYTFRNAEDDEDKAVIDIDGQIGFDIWKELFEEEPEQNTMESIKERLRNIEASKILVNINSLGGDVIDGISIMDLLAEKDAEIETRVYGFTASAATVIAQAGSDGKRTMSANGLYLIHRAMIMLLGVLNQNDAQSIINDLKPIDSNIANIYAKRSGRKRSEFESLMDEENGNGIWLTAEEAKDYGLIDEIFEPSEESAQNIRKNVDLAKGLGLNIPENKLPSSYLNISDSHKDRETGSAQKIDARVRDREIEIYQLKQRRGNYA